MSQLDRQAVWKTGWCWTRARMDPGPGKPLELSLMIPSVNQLFSLTPHMHGEQGLSLSECSHNLTAPLALGESPWAETVGPGATVTGSWPAGNAPPLPGLHPQMRLKGCCPRIQFVETMTWSCFSTALLDVSSGPVPHSTRGGLTWGRMCPAQARLQSQCRPSLLWKPHFSHWRKPRLYGYFIRSPPWNVSWWS